MILKTYKTRKNGKLMAARAYVRGIEKEYFPRLLIDTGSTYTIIAQEILETIGCSPARSCQREYVATANGYMIIPAVQIKRFSCLGQYWDDMLVLAHTFPSSTYIDGLLGMDFLSKYLFEIRPKSGKVVRRDP
ncbi:MAG: hypothetical protein B6245_05070 [Desulfobacteraceae bacterium 4572_88]|nr:MAG: hypothetical protein B6245_05070 [Desulfobacteraceae bacterium 4572_88]